MRWGTHALAEEFPVDVRRPSDEDGVQEPEPEQQEGLDDDMFDVDGVHLWDPSIRRCPPDKWECSVAQGGCSYFNPKTLFYCDMCSKARPDLSAVRFSVGERHQVLSSGSECSA